MDGPIYPDIEVQLTGHSGNAGTIIGSVAEALRRGGAPPAKVNDFRKEAMSGDYDHLLQTAMRWVDVS